MARRAGAGMLLAMLVVVLISAAAVTRATSSQSINPVPAESDLSFMQFATAQEIVFLDEMQAHHRQAIVLAELIRARSRDETLISIATAVAADSPGELRTINSWLESSGIDIRAGVSPSGLTTSSQLRSLSKLRGAVFDWTAANLLLRNQMISAELAHASTTEPHKSIANLADVISRRQDKLVERLLSYVRLHPRSSGR